MFEKSKGRYLTRGVDAEIPLYLQMFLWDAVDNMPEPKDYLQVFRLSKESGLQIVHHTSEQPQFEMTYIAETEKPVTRVLTNRYKRANTSNPTKKSKPYA